jgi:hypothetical protein
VVHLSQRKGKKSGRHLFTVEQCVVAKQGLVGFFPSLFHRKPTKRVAVKKEAKQKKSRMSSRGS